VSPAPIRHDKSFTHFGTDSPPDKSSAVLPSGQSRLMSPRA
jgi:hypothetical protein